MVVPIQSLKDLFAETEKFLLAGWEANLISAPNKLLTRRPPHLDRQIFRGALQTVRNNIAVDFCTFSHSLYQLQSLVQTSTLTCLVTNLRPTPTFYSATCSQNPPTMRPRSTSNPRHPQLMEVSHQQQRALIASDTVLLK